MPLHPQWGYIASIHHQSLHNTSKGCGPMITSSHTHHPLTLVGCPLGGGRGVQYRMSIDRAPIGGIHALSIATPHTRGVGGCINGSIASTTPSHSPGAITPRVPIGGGRPAPHAPGVAHPTPHVTVTSHGHSR